MGAKPAARCTLKHKTDWGRTLMNPMALIATGHGQQDEFTMNPVTGVGGYNIYSVPIPQQVLSQK